MKKLHIIFLLILALGVPSQTEAAARAASGGSGEGAPAKRARTGSSTTEVTVEAMGGASAAAGSTSPSTSEAPLVFADPKFDTSFKHMLGIDEEDGVARLGRYDVLSSFISTFLGRPVTIVRSSIPFIPPLREGSESQRAMDIACEDDKGVRYNVEMQQSKQSFWDARAIYYLSALYENQLNSAAYDTLRPAVGISVLGYDRTDFEDYKRHFKLVDVQPHAGASAAGGAGTSSSSSSSASAATSPIVLNQIELVEISLPRVHLASSLGSLEHQWLTLLNNAASLKEIPAEINDPMVIKAFTRLKYATWGDTVKAAYETEIAKFKEQQELIRQAEIVAEARGETRGEAKGQINTAIKIAKNMRDKGFAPDVIAATTELPLEEVTKLFAEKS